ncbi:MAG: helix-turn-helix transcriptional regulator, partial [Acidobacteriota bacterium]|nr:helix-turn-helix transcriptional regulator [Acidobacteriota bacterium]
QAAHELLGPLVGQLVAMGPGDPVIGMFIPDEVEALLALGRVDDAAAVLDWFDQRAHTVGADWALALAARCRGAIAATRRDTDAASAAFQAALAAHDRCPIPFERARTLLVAGRYLRRAKQRGAALAALDEAVQVFNELGAVGWAARAYAERERIGRRASDTDTLTRSERLIAELAASGLTNREVAERAFVSVKTVEANLTRVYRKLGVRSRVSLARALQT